MSVLFWSLKSGIEMLCRKLKLYLSYLQIKLLSLIRAMVFKISGADGAKTWNFQLLNRCSDQRMLEVWPPQKWGFWCQIRFWGPKNIKGGPKKWKKLFFSKRANLIFYLKSYLASVNLMGTSFTGICLKHQLLIFWLTRRGLRSYWES